MSVWIDRVDGPVEQGPTRCEPPKTPQYRVNGRAVRCLPWLGWRRRAPRWCDSACGRAEAPVRYAGPTARAPVVRNFSVVAGAQAITWTATFLFTLAHARYLSPARFGELSLAASYFVMLGVLVDFGLSAKLARDVAQRPAAAGKALVASF